MSSLLLELAFTRLFSVILFYHFAFMVISIALLGLGAGGVFAFLHKEWLSRIEICTLAGWLCVVNALLIVIVMEIDLYSPLTLNLTVNYLISALPFFLVGLLFSVLFARQPERITSLYGADLIGGATACIALVPLLNWIGAPNTVVGAAMLMGLAAFFWAGKSRLGYVGVATAALLALLVGLNLNNQLIDIVSAKGVRRSKAEVLWARWNAISRVEVDHEGDGRYIRIDSDAATAIMNVDPARWDVDLPRDRAEKLAWRNLVPSEQSGTTYNWKRDLMSAAPAMVNVLRPHGDYAVIGPGGGVDVMRAVANGATSVTAIEINPLIANTIMRGTHADYSYHLYERPNVHLHVADGRSWIRASKDKYDVIQMTLVDTWASTAAGAFALSENNLYTVEAFKEYFDHLKPDGIIAITRWEFKEPREALRVVSVELETMRQLGIESDNRFIVISDGALDTDGRPVTVLVKKTAFTDAEIESAASHLNETKNLKEIFMPCGAVPSGGVNLCHDVAPSRGVPGVTLASSGAFYWLLLDRKRDSFIRDYEYDISPSTDDAPFFFFTIKTGEVLKRFWTGTGRGVDWRVNMGSMTLGLVLVVSLVTVFAFLVLPMTFRSNVRGAASVPKLLYFVAVGLGFILVEVSFIQRFVLFLGHPTYALTVVVFLLLLSSGVGSLFSRRWMASGERIPWVLASIAACIGMLAMVLPRLLESQIGQPFPLKVGIAGALLIPLGLAMGMPFPTGLRMLANSNMVEWAWAMNAAATVLGSVSAIVIAIHFGLTLTLLCGALAYLIAAALTPRLVTV